MSTTISIKKKMKTVSFDLDGILNNYPKCFLDYVNASKKIKFRSIDNIKKNSLKNYESLKDAYRKSNYKYNLKISKKLVNIINKFSLHYNVLIITTRPFAKYKKMYRKTFLWLKKNNIKNFKLFSKKKSIFTKNEILLHIDDKEEDINKIYNKNTLYFLTSKYVIKKRKNIVVLKKTQLISTLNKFLIKNI